MVFDVPALEIQSDSKNYVSVQDDEITELVDHIFCFCVSLHCSYTFLRRVRCSSVIV